MIANVFSHFILEPDEKVIICRALHECSRVLLNLLNELGKKIDALPSILSVFPKDVNTFNNIEARMQDTIYHMTLKSH